MDWCYLFSVITMGTDTSHDLVMLGHYNVPYFLYPFFTTGGNYTELAMIPQNFLLESHFDCRIKYID